MLSFYMNNCRNNYFRSNMNVFKEDLNQQMAEILRNHEENQNCMNSSLEALNQEVEKKLTLMKLDTELPLSLCFTAFRDDDYFGKGEENLRFTGCSVNTNEIMDPRQKHLIQYQVE